MEQEVKSGISRRKVAAGIAWTVPTVAVVSALPARAAVLSPLVVAVPGPACKYPGNSAGAALKFSYMFSVTYTNISSIYTVEVDATSGQVVFNNSNGTTDTVPGNPAFYDKAPHLPGATVLETFKLDPGASKTVYAIVTQSSSANKAGEVTVTFSVTTTSPPPRGTITYSDEVSQTFTATPPDCEVQYPA